MQKFKLTMVEALLLFKLVEATDQPWFQLEYNNKTQEYYNNESIMSAEQCQDAIYHTILNGYEELPAFLATADEARIFYSILIKISDTTDVEKQKALYLIGKRLEKIIAEKEA